MTLEGKQIDTCEACGRVYELQPAGGMMLCDGCRPTVCPRCGVLAGAWWGEYSMYECANCGETYIP